REVSSLNNLFEPQAWLLDQVLRKFREVGQIDRSSHFGAFKDRFETMVASMEAIAGQNEETGIWKAIFTEFTYLRALFVLEDLLKQELEKKAKSSAGESSHEPESKS